MSRDDKIDILVLVLGVAAIFLASVGVGVILHCTSLMLC